jgi:hypothetical protein
MPGPHFHTTDAQQLEVADPHQCNTVYIDCALGVEGARLKQHCAKATAACMIFWLQTIDAQHFCTTTDFASLN